MIWHLSKESKMEADLTYSKHISSGCFFTSHKLKQNRKCFVLRLSGDSWPVWRSIIIRRFKPILSAGLRFHSHLSGGLRLRNYRAVAGNHKFSSWFSVFACFLVVIQTELRGSEDWAVTSSYLKLLSLTKDCLLGLNQVSQGFSPRPQPCGEGWRGNLK